MNDHDVLMQKQENEEFAVWLRTAATTGAVLFLVFSVLDFVVFPELAPQFFVYRTVIAAYLGGTALLSIKCTKPGLQLLLGLLAVIASAATIEAMVLRTGGYASHYATGMILLVVCIFVYAQGRILFHVLAALAIYVIYVLPIVATEHITNFRSFIASNFFILSIILVMLALRYLAQRSVLRQNAERRRAEESLRESEARYRVLFEQSPDGVLLADPQGAIIDFNDQVNSQLGYTREEFSKLRIADIDPVEGPEDIKARFDMVTREGKAEFEVKHRTRSGELRDVLVIARTVAVAGRTYHHTIWRDVTERKRVEETLRKSEELLRQAVRVSQIGIFDHDHAVTTIYWSPEQRAIYGWGAEEAVTLPAFVELIHPGDREAIATAVRRAHDPAGNGLFDVEYRILRRDGEVRWLSTRSRTFFDGEGGARRPVRTVGASLDITERKRMERSLKESEEKFRTLFESASDALFIIDLNGKILDANVVAYERLGYTKEELLSLTLSQLVPPAVAAVLPERMEHTKKHGWSWIEAAHVRKDGSSLPVEVNARVITLHGEKVIFSIIRDITERRHMQEQLEQKAAEQNAILENAFVGIAFLKDRRFFWINGKMEQMFGYERGEVAGLTTELFYPSRESYEELGREAYPLLASGETYNTERLMKRKDGSVFWCSLSGKAIDPAVPAKGAIWILQDITQRKSAEEEIKRINQNLENLVSERSRELKQTNKRLIAEIEERKWVEEELIKAQKLESLGILAGGIAHDFNNMLTTILGNLSLAMLDVAQSAPVHRSLETAETAALRAQNLTKQLLTFAKGGALVKQTVAIGELVRESVAFALRGSRVKYDVSLQDDLWLVEADEDQLVQVMHNLVINADHAMPQGGTISVRCENCKLKDNEALSVAAGKYVRIIVRDTGMGIPKDHLLKIFDPYFTTKQKGSGLGLATVYSVIQKHGGRIFAESTLGDGATFTILLPASDAVAVSRKPVENAVPSGAGKILVMDDEADIRQTACDILERLGYSAMQAADGESVIKLYQEALRAGDPFKAVIMDLTIPGGMGGVETLQILRELDPDVKAIVSSGYSNDPVMAEYRKYGFADVVAKPYRVRDFGEVVHRVIHGTGDGRS